MLERDASAMRVLVVEAEAEMAGLLKRGFDEESHPAHVAPSGEEALEMVRTDAYDAIVLDRTLPGLDGFATCRELRSQGVSTPVLFLTARDAAEDCVTALDLGADDCLVKPFSFSELLARLRALVRRAAQAERPAPSLVDDLLPDRARRGAR
jgi:two-component system OmpR family response regulator